MNKGIKKVRESIKKRKRSRGHLYQTKTFRNEPSIFPKEEEKHGYLIDVPDYESTDQPIKLFKAPVLIKGMLSLALFFGLSFLLDSDFDILSKPKTWAERAVTEEFPFARVYHWYHQAFGNPLAFHPKEQIAGQDHDFISLPVNGQVIETFQMNGTGILIEPEQTETVNVWNGGIIIFAGNKKDTGQTIVVQHPDLSKTTYGHLSSIDVHLYQYVSSGQKIGVFNPTETSRSVYFSIERDDEYLDPVQVIQVDDHP